MSSIELVVFDMAGTTVRDGDAVHTCLRAALESSGISVSRDEVNEVMGIPKPVAIRLLLEKYTSELTTVGEAGVMSIHTEFEVRMLEFYSSDTSVREIDGASAVFGALRSAGIKVALDTGFNRPIADAVINRLGWETPALVDAVVTSDDVARGRPHPDMIYRAMELTGVSDAARVVKVGDTPADLQEGTSAGCGWVVGVTQGSHSRGQLEMYPHTHLIGTVADLQDVIPLPRSGGEVR
jgi:phosphonatase-like hydrolase